MFSYKNNTSCCSNQQIFAVALCVPAAFGIIQDSLGQYSIPQADAVKSLLKKKSFYGLQRHKPNFQR